jgi:hypothetical protein
MVAIELDQEHPKAMPIVLEVIKSKAIGEMIQIVPIGCHVKNGNVKVINQLNN